MRLDSANRSFLAFVVLALLLGACVLCGAVGAVLAPLLLERVSHGGRRACWATAHASLLLLPFVVLVAGGLALASRLACAAALASHRLACRVRELALTLPGELTRAATSSGVGWACHAPGCAGIVLVRLRRAEPPRGGQCAVLLDRISGRELRAVLEHERYHVCNLDPLKIVLVRALSAAFFFLPALDALCARYVAARELAADRRAVALCGRRPLVGALLEVVRGPAWSELDVAARSALRAAGRPSRPTETGAQPMLQAQRHSCNALAPGRGVVLAMFLVSVFSFGGPAAVYRATGTGLSTVDLLSGLICAAPFAAAGLVAYWLLARRASRSLATKRES